MRFPLGRDSWVSHSLRSSLLVGLLVVLAGPAVAQSEAASAWQRIIDLRAELIRSGPQEWTFTQNFVPGGFTSGETETGRLGLDLPLCARWDYDDPYPKSFLLCGRELYSWNPGEPVGHVFAIDSSQPGIDLIRLDAEGLAERYRAEAIDTDTVQLTPKDETQGLLREAELTFSSEPFYLKRLSYRDAEGNQTTFEFATPAPLEGRSRFEPPARVSWEIEGSGGL